MVSYITSCRTRILPRNMVILITLLFSHLLPFRSESAPPREGVPRFWTVKPVKVIPSGSLPMRLEPDEIFLSSPVFPVKSWQKKVNVSLSAGWIRWAEKDYEESGIQMLHNPIEVQNLLLYPDFPLSPTQFAVVDSKRFQSLVERLLRSETYPIAVAMNALILLAGYELTYIQYFPKKPFPYRQFKNRLISAFRTYLKEYDSRTTDFQVGLITSISSMVPRPLDLQNQWNDLKGSAKINSDGMKMVMSFCSLIYAELDKFKLDLREKQDLEIELQNLEKIYKFAINAEVVPSYVTIGWGLYQKLHSGSEAPVLRDVLYFADHFGENIWDLRPSHLVAGYEARTGQPPQEIVIRLLTELRIAGAFDQNPRKPPRSRQFYDYVKLLILMREVSLLGENAFSSGEDWARYHELVEDWYQFIESDLSQLKMEEQTPFSPFTWKHGNLPFRRLMTRSSLSVSPDTLDKNGSGNSGNNQKFLEELWRQVRRSRDAGSMGFQQTVSRIDTLLQWIRGTKGELELELARVIAYDLLCLRLNFRYEHAKGWDYIFGLHGNFKKVLVGQPMESEEEYAERSSHFLAELKAKTLSPHFQLELFLWLRDNRIHAKTKIYQMALARAFEPAIEKGWLPATPQNQSIFNSFKAMCRRVFGFRF